MIVQFLKKILDNIKIINSTNGKNGFEQFKLHKPDLIITDLWMPIMDGIEMQDLTSIVLKYVPLT